MKYLKIEGFFRTGGFDHEFSKLLLQPVFRWGDAGTREVMGWLVINIGKIRGGRVVTFKTAFKTASPRLKTGCSSSFENS